VSQPLQPGDPAPAFQLPSTRGGPARLADFSGRILVLFFYPKDDTDACTREAIAFSAAQAKFTRRGASVLGVSKDSLADHKAFVAKHKLTVRLASDESGEACEAWGVWQEKQLYGHKFMGIVRSTFIVTPEGLIHRVWRNVRVPGHVDAVLNEIASLR
jgi:peroxiredoxin Q/BCP